jgi:hypothetical protein
MIGTRPLDKPHSELRRPDRHAVRPSDLAGRAADASSLILAHATATRALEEWCDIIGLSQGPIWARLLAPVEAVPVAAAVAEAAAPAPAVVEAATPADAATPKPPRSRRRAAAGPADGSADAAASAAVVAAAGVGPTASAAPAPVTMAAGSSVAALDAAVPAEDLLRAVRGAERKLVREVRLFDVYSGQGVPEGKRSLAVAVLVPGGTRGVLSTAVCSLAVSALAVCAPALGPRRPPHRAACRPGQSRT